MPAALFIPEEHNCCYRYSYSGALQPQLPLAQLIIQRSIHSHIHTLRLTHATHTLMAPLSYSGRPPSRLFQCISQSGAVDPRENFSHIELPANKPLAHRADINMAHVPAPRLQIIMLVII